METYENPQEIAMQRTIVFVVPSPNCYIYNIILHPRLRGHFRRPGGEILESQRNRKFAR